MLSLLPLLLLTREVSSHWHNRQGRVLSTTGLKPNKNAAVTISSNEYVRNSGDKKVIAYWEGYYEGDVKPYRLKEVPENIDYIPIAFIAPRALDGESMNNASGWEFDQTFVYSKQEIFSDIAEIKNRKKVQKVLLSLLDSPTCHWDQVNIPAFAKNIVADAKMHGIDGFDMDIESGMDETKFSGKFIDLIKSIKHEDPNMIVTYVTMGNPHDEEILAETKHLIQHVTTMRYWDEQHDLFERYGKIVGYENVGVGVMTQVTPLETVSDIARYTASKGSKLMMLWSLTRDVHECSNERDGEWQSHIYSEFKNSRTIFFNKNEKIATKANVQLYRPDPTKVDRVFSRRQGGCIHGPDMKLPVMGVPEGY